MSKKKYSRRIKLGDIYAIPLPDGTYAFGRVYKDASMAFFKARKTTMELNDNEMEIDFFVAVYTDLLKDEVWVFLKNMPFHENEETWPPMTYIEDQLVPNTYRLYYKGEMRKSTKEECLGLEVAAVWDRGNVEGRLMGNNQWTEICH